MIHQGELSAARQVLNSAGLAPGTAETLTELQDPERRPREMHFPLSDDVVNFRNASPLKLNRRILISNMRKARRGVAPGPSGITAEHIRPILESEEDTRLFVHMCNHLANVQVPSDI